MDIHQLQATYQQEQDRILLRLNTRTQEEFRLWLTRRMVKNFYPHLVEVSKRMGGDTAHHVSHDGGLADDLAGFQQQESLATADFETPFSGETTALPAGSEPLLVTQMKISQLDDHNLHLALEEKMADGSTTRAFEVTLGLPIIHALLHLLDLVIKSADWGLTPVPGVPASEPSPGMDAFETAERPQYLN